MSVIDEIYEVDEATLSDMQAFEEEREPEEEQEQKREFKFGIDSVVKRLRWWESKLAAKEAAFEPVIDRMEEELHFIRSKIESYEKYLEWCVPVGSEHVDDNVALYYTQSQRTHVFDPKAIPIEYCEIKDPTPMVAEISRALKLNKKVPGAELLTINRLQIKPGGEKAKAAAKRRAKKAEKLAEAQAKAGIES